MRHGEEQIDAAVFGDVEHRPLRRRHARLLLQRCCELLDAHAFHVAHVIQLRDGRGGPARVLREVVLNAVAVHGHVAPEPGRGHEHVHGDAGDGVLAYGVLNDRLHSVRAGGASKQGRGVLFVCGQVAVGAEKVAGLAEAVFAHAHKAFDTRLVNLFARHVHDFAANVGKHHAVRLLGRVTARDQTDLLDLRLKAVQLVLHQGPQHGTHLEDVSSVHAAVQQRAVAQPHAEVHRRRNRGSCVLGVGCTKIIFYLINKNAPRHQYFANLVFRSR